MYFWLENLRILELKNLLILWGLEGIIIQETPTHINRNVFFLQKNAGYSSKLVPH
ncbi:hypothetical protein CNEO2_560040 [Clostridium neonatale]|nr:hypothetical protein CNEO2_560040 [Clostridium neonatale]